jgi:hypothetical protein
LIDEFGGNWRCVWLDLKERHSIAVSPRRRSWLERLSNEGGDNFTGGFVLLAGKSFGNREDVVVDG